MINKSAFSILICPIILFLGINTHAQFMVDTLTEVSVKGKKTDRKPNFNTFTKSISLNGTHYGYTIMPNSGNATTIIVLAIQVQNNKGAMVRLDSMFIKSTPLDTAKVKLGLQVYTNDKLFSEANLKVINRRGKVSTIHFDSALYLPSGISYIGLSYEATENFSFKFYTNKKVEGYLYTYNKESDEFKSLPCEGCPPATCPQVKIYYTKIED